jgi:transglutaminase-like putative cysteine protease
VSAAAARAGRAAAAEPTLAVPVARALAFAALCGFGLLQWMQLLEPAASGRAGSALLAALAAVAGLLLAGRLPGRARAAAAILVGVGALALALLAGGVDDEQLSPGRWGDLAAGIGRGVSALPGARVPYRGLDEWTRLSLSLGGAVLAVLAALLAFWPRRGALGLRAVSCVLLVALYAVPVVALDLSAEFLQGALLALLVLAYLRLERLRITDAGAAAALALAVTVLGLVAAPALDKDQPWWDYETWALSNAASRTTEFAWDHDYGPLDWPRDGRELLRVKARRPAYWKATNLDDFDGARWVRDRSSTNLDGCDVSAYLAEHAGQGLQQIRVSVRNLRTQTFITAGVACRILGPPRMSSLPLGDGTYASMSRELRRGDTYGALVYTPNPNGRERSEAPRTYPASLSRYVHIELPPRQPRDLDPAAAPPALGFRVQFPMFGQPGRPQAWPADNSRTVSADARKLLRRGPYARTYALARRLSRGAETQEEIVQAVLAHLRSDRYAYTESPPPEAENLEGFLFDARLGYCQQYSGAMALLLRMAGVPARVSTGFTTGALDRDEGEYVVRDLDAHSWVEVWYADWGWVTMDPTPAAAPARSQADEQPDEGVAAAQGAPDLGGDVRTDVGRLATTEEQTPWTLIAAGAAALLLAGGLGLWLRRRHRRRMAAGWGPVAELERALARARRAPGPAATLSTVERLFARTPAAAGYVRALRDQRYAGREGAPAPAGRRAVRAELARGGGLAGRVRAWWALPPRPR